MTNESNWAVTSIFFLDTVDGSENPAPIDMVNIRIIYRISYISSINSKKSFKRYQRGWYYPVQWKICHETIRYSGTEILSEP